MTTYSAEVNIYNPEAIADAVEEAADAHKAYITEVSADNGIVVAAQGKGTVNGVITSATTGWHLADVLEYIRQGVSRFWIGLKNQGDTSPTVRIGKDYIQGASDNESHMELDYHSLQMMDKEGNAYFHVSDLRDAQGVYEKTDTWTQWDEGTTLFYLTNVAQRDGGTDEDPVYDYLVTVDDVEVTSGINKTHDSFWFDTAPELWSHISATYTVYSEYTKAYTLGSRRAESGIGGFSFAEGYDNIASGLFSHVEGFGNMTSGQCSHAEGWGTEASGQESHAEGSITHATGPASHAEGSSTRATTNCAHAEGDSTVASGLYSHAEGYGSQAIGDRSHVQNLGTVSSWQNQTVIGKYNLDDGVIAQDGAFIIGNGTSDTARSNAFAVDWDGYIYPMAEKMADWIVEQGTSGIWTYRKWHSGIAECWGNYTGSIAINTSSGSYGGYRSGLITVNLPSNLFAAWPTTTATMATSGGGWVNNVSDTSKTAVKFYLSSGTSQSAANRTVCFHCSGKWK